MSERKIVKYYDTTEYLFSEYTLSNFLYSKGFSFTPGQTVATLKTPITKPRSLTKIDMLEIIFDEYTHSKMAHDITYLSIEVGLFDDDGDIYYNGSNWVSGSTYNTIDDFLDNIQSYAYNYAKGIGFRFKFTRDVKYQDNALIIKLIKVLKTYDFNYTQDVIYSSLRSELESINVRSRAFKLKFTGSTINFNDFDLKSTYRNAVPTHVFNQSDDPYFNNNLFSSYDSSSKVITISETLSSKNIVVYFNYNPTVHIWTSNDYKEVSLLPYICVEDIVEQNLSTKSNVFDDTIMDYYNDVGYEIPAPSIKNYEMQLSCETNSNFDNLHLKEAVDSWAQNITLLKLIATDTYVDIRQESGFDDATFPEMSDMKRSVCRLFIYRVPHYLTNLKSTKPVSSITISSSSGSDVGGSIDLTI